MKPWLLEPSSPLGLVAWSPTSLSHAPSEVDDKQLKELSIKLDIV
jgi:hypothetical protein